DSDCASMRTATSVTEPAAVGRMKRTGLAGNGCPTTGVGRMSAPRTAPRTPPRIARRTAPVRFLSLIPIIAPGYVLGWNSLTACKFIRHPMVPGGPSMRAARIVLFAILASTALPTSAPARPRIPLLGAVVGTVGGIMALRHRHAHA